MSDREMRILERAASAAAPGRAKAVADYALGRARLRRQRCPRCGTPTRLARNILRRREGTVDDAFAEMFRIVRRVVGPAATSAETQEVVTRSVAKLMTVAYMDGEVEGCPSEACEWNASHGWCDPTTVEAGALGRYRRPDGREFSVVVLHVIGNPEVSGARARLARVTSWLRTYDTPSMPGGVWPVLTAVQFSGFNLERFSDGEWSSTPYPVLGPAEPFYPTCLVRPDGVEAEDESEEVVTEPAAAPAATEETS